ncbi:MAG: methionine adenosyltransferase [Bacteroidia bacterium]|nr:methionine adenosyltransferase [Bacteroidia bacterium]MDW8157596.1 methionine adenosyltransferase [Bacteroidia bacterium]
MPYLFTSESVSEGHPDKIADQISDAILDAMLAQDPNSRVACETLVTSGLVVVAGEVKTNAYVEIPDIVRQTIESIGYTKSEYHFDAKSCGILVALHQQSQDIARGVDQGENKPLGAGDQGMMFGYATKETVPEYMPLSLVLSHRLMRELAKIRKTETALMPYLRPDSKSQVTIEYNDDGSPLRVHTVVVSTQHDEFASEEKMQKKIYEDIVNILIPRVIPADLLDSKTIYHVNPTGKFVIGGPDGDAGLTGRKIIVDTYGGRGAHGGGAFSGKDSSKVDRSAAYAARYIAKNLVHAGVAEEVLIQVSYAIGIPQPISIHVKTFGTAKEGISDSMIASKIREIFDLSPKGIIERFQLQNPIYRPTATYGHFGREAVRQSITTNYISIQNDGEKTIETKVKGQKEVLFFPWEALDCTQEIKSAFGL